MVENHLGQKLLIDNINYKLIKADGLTPAGATINQAGVGIEDGTSYNSSYVKSRNIVLTIVPEGNFNGNIERKRMDLYRYFKPKYRVKLYIKTAYRNVCINGYVESVEGDLFSKKQNFQVSIICPKPFFEDITPVTALQRFVDDEFYFPVSIPKEGITLSSVNSRERVIIDNKGDETTGIIISMSANNNVIKPTIYNITTRKTFSFDCNMTAGDVVVIDTRRGTKTITLYRNGFENNILNTMVSGSHWFEVPTGTNDFTYRCEYGEENLKVNYKLYPLYEGV